MTTTPATPSEGRPLTRAQSIILGTAGVAMVGIGVVGAVGTYTNLTTRFPGPTALGFVAAGEGATVILALAYVGLTMLGQSSPAAVRLGLWLLPSLASGTGATVAHSVRDAVVYAVTPVAMCVAAEGAGLLARRIVVRTTGTDAEAQRRNAVTMRRLAYERARAANHPRGRTRRRAELASWRLARHVGTGDTALGTHLVTVQRERLAEGADLALAAMFTPAVTAVTAGRDAIEPAVTGGVTAVTPGRDGVTAAVTPALPEAPEPPPAGAETGDAVTPVQAHFTPFVAIAIRHVERQPRRAAEQCAHPNGVSVVHFRERRAWRRHVAEDLERQRQIVRRQIPDTVNVRSRAGPVRPRAAHAGDRADFAGPRDFPELLDAGVIPPDVSHEQPIAAARQEAFRVGDARGERLLDEHRYPARQQSVDHRRMRYCRRGDNERVNLGQIVDIDDRPGAKRGGRGARLLVEVRDNDGRPERNEITKDERAPAAAADQSDNMP